MEEGNIDSETKEEKKTGKYSIRQWTILIIFGIINFLSTTTYSMQAPFYPAEAESKGATATEYGLVFGVFELIVFICSPICGKYINRIGPNKVFTGGIFITSVAVVCFGLTDRINDRTTFVVVCFICRVIEGLGSTGFFNATFTITACEFPDAISTTLAILETFIGVGLVTGPTVGAALFSVGGFQLPFFTVGIALFLWGLLGLAAMPKMDKATDKHGNAHEGYSVWTILKITPVAFSALSNVIIAASLSFVGAILEPHIRQFQLTTMQTGLVFIVSGVVYSLSAPIFGCISDRVRNPIYISIFGNFLNVFAFLLIGPASLVPIDDTLWVTIVGLVLAGLSMGCCLIANFTVATRESMKHGLPDNIATYGVVSGMWNSAISLGAFLGAPIAGVLFDYVGFRHASWVIVLGSIITGTTMLIHTVFFPGNDDAREESQPILGSSSTSQMELSSKTSPYGSISSKSSEPQSQ